MKSVVFLWLTLWAALCLTACDTSNKEVVEPATNQTIVVQDTSAYTGQLSVQVIGLRSDPLTNADVWLYASYTDYQNKLDLLYLRTDAEGRANFGFVNFGNYYLEATANIQDTLRQTVDVVQVRSRQVVEKRLVVK